MKAVVSVIVVVVVVGSISVFVMVTWTVFVPVTVLEMVIDTVGKTVLYPVRPECSVRAELLT